MGHVILRLIQSKRNKTKQVNTSERLISDAPQTDLLLKVCVADDVESSETLRGISAKWSVLPNSNAFFKPRLLHKAETLDDNRPLMNT